MAQTYAHLKIEGKDWLVPEPIPTWSKLEHPWEIEAHHNYTVKKTNWLEIHPDHVTEFEGRKGLVEGKDFWIIDHLMPAKCAVLPMPKDDGLQDWRDLIDMVSEGKHIDELQQSFTLKKKV
jgi:hypothetical protein